MSNNLLPFSYRNILGIALPMMVSGFIQSIVLITNSAFISRYSVDGFDAVGNAGLVYITFFIMLMGMSDGAQILMARRIGEERKNAVGRQLLATWVVLAFMAVLFFVALKSLVPNLIQYFSLNKTVANLQIDYLSYRSFGLFFSFISLGLQAFYLAQGRTGVVLISALVTALSNILLDYLLIFGVGSFPEMGVAGAGLGACISEGLSMLFLLSYTRFSKSNVSFHLLQQVKGLGTEIKELLKVGIPLMLQSFSALFTWTLFFTWIEQMGQFALTVSQNIRSLYFLAFVPIWGFASTTKTYISQYIGAGKQIDLPKIQRRIQLLTLLFLALFFHGALLYPEALIGIINPHQEYLETSCAILQLIIGSVFIYGFVSVYFQTIHGSGNTLVSMAIEIFSVLVYMAFVYLFIKVLHFEIYYVWTVEYIYFGTMGLLSMGYLYFFTWNQKKI